jgi:putative transposase
VPTPSRLRRLRRRPPTVGDMARPPRMQICDGTYHVTSRGNSRRKIFIDESDQIRFLTLFGLVVQLRRWTCHGYCLMPSHYHLLFTTKEADLARGMQRLNSTYAQSFNKRYADVGHVFQGRYYSVLVETERHMVELCRYIALNPVRAGLCDRAEDWPWSSYRAVAGLVEAPAFLSVEETLKYFGNDTSAARRELVDFVSEGAASQRADRIEAGSDPVSTS